MHTPVSQLALFDVTGDDAASFLQGQLTQDVLHWQPNEIKRAAWCNVKGRMLASFYLWPIEHGFRFIVARDLAAKVLPRLRMFVMRAKVLVSEPLDISLFATRTPLPALSLAEQQLSLLPSGFGVSTDANLATSDDWLLAHIQAGVAWISAVNSEQFVPQTTNFELVGGINFRKGCYPGQEIVARSQYLGKLKQRAAIAQCDRPATALQDVFEAQVDSITPTSSPVGRVIQTSGQWLLFEAPHALIESGAALALAPHAPLRLQALPYAVLDITA